MPHLVEWDSLDIRIDGAKVNAVVREQIAGDGVVEHLELQFSNGLLRVEGRVRKILSVPFSVEVAHLEATGLTVRAHLMRISAGPIPIPTLLVGMLRKRFPEDLVRFEDPATLVLVLDRFLPSFVAAEIRAISIIDGGLAVTLGRGGVDLPFGGANSGGSNGGSR